ncbi:AAA family ATPase [Streptomyces triticirhizae]|uniref:ATP-binding protein n=1 Tax=Streptomyces triticirhizae TaxID=2483353 RepID=A0A3M2M6G7_9ACTN|nr:AAA family ATPase [Streptomyces triticirhizae]RMI45186.1 ATP-binding protein [Streptomyces triticirhizae]
MERTIRLAVSGTYSTGKTTTTEAISIATGIPRTHALTARDILHELLPGRRLDQLSASELMVIGFRRMEERIHHEAAAMESHGSFVADGSVIHEWVYGHVRMRVGINPQANRASRIAREIAGIPFKPMIRQTMDAWGTVVRNRARNHYDAFVHLPVETHITQDGHRPVSEEFRKLGDRLLLETVADIGIPHHVVRGTVEERVGRIAEIFDLPLVMPLDEAVKLAVDSVREQRESLARRASEQEAANPVPRRRRLKYAIRF